MADYNVKFSQATGERFTLTPSLGVIPCEYRYTWHTAETRATFHSQNVSVYIQPLLCIRPQKLRNSAK